MDMTRTRSTRSRRPSRRPSRSCPSPSGASSTRWPSSSTDEPTPAQLASVHAWGLFGLYQGVPRTAYAADAAATPSKITLFRGPLMRANRSPERLRAAVGETLRHEVAHHLGISDARLQELERQRR